MEKCYNIEVVETTAIKLVADATKLVEKEGVDGYARAWLNITNNVKSNKNDLFKLYNDYDNGIYLICADNEYIAKATKDYMERLGMEIVREEKVAIIQPMEVFNDDMEVELIDW